MGKDESNFEWDVDGKHKKFPFVFLCASAPLRETFLFQTKSLSLRPMNPIPQSGSQIAKRGRKATNV